MNEEAYAPYNFIPFPEQIISRYARYDDLPSHDGNNSDKGLLSGIIEFDITAQTPILVADGTSRSKENESRYFVKNVDGKYEIPGSSLRGLIRQTLSVLSLSNWADQIEDESFYYRSVAGNKHVRKEYRSILGFSGNETDKEDHGARNVQAGYIVKENDDHYVIYKARSDGGRKGFTYYKCHQSRFPFLRKKIKEGFQICNVSFSVNQDGKVVRLDVSKKEKLAFQGKMIFSGPMRNKKNAYVINDIDKKATPIKIDPADVKAYQADYEFRSKKFKKDEKQKEFSKLPDKKGIEHAKPCFYVYLNGRLYFGFTLYLRLKYNWSTKKLLPKQLQKSVASTSIDYTKALFGFTQQVMPESSKEDSKEKSYASRLSFFNARVISESGEETVDVVLGEPRASALGMYLKQPDSKIRWTYNNETAELRGLKQYWMKAEQKSQSSENKNVLQKLHLLRKGTTFRAKIRFDQLYEDELGLLLWSLQGPKYHQIGMGKPYGYGIVSFDHFSVFVNKNEADLYQLSSYFDLKMKHVSPVDYIEKYKQYVKKAFGIDIDRQGSVRIFLKMKDWSPLPYSKMKYMPLNNYKKMPILPTAQLLLDNEKVQNQSKQKK
ncbi:TIGR03986 family CRISPR-associated RAMP protein [Caldibacillus thermoamylovorans]|uniref:TIGR03986 family type III CRISPR-associated RAMP protein n=1 Tax=Caldibacillus thermoamylovorans TaxID=35841 RepID=UPI001D07F6A5|nr:TIGR03986 family CRISPR-associated RAMP protein [Caldibacillus thermoamylovorans]MCB5936074.1 TIGR03986 family CRISPR-associated RAMP protein [Bacillus sp. DFI.2.34]MCB7077423.1 TIGR03986 family CRISPR-associated RAMP protein [Caldibacillus thermoamylovorans]